MYIIRKAEKKDLNGIIKIHIDTWKTSYKGVVPDDYIQAFEMKTRDKNWQKLLLKMIEEQIFYLAENEEDKLIGFAIGGLERSNNPNYKGELMGIYIIKEYQRQGIGKVLVKKIVQGLIEININSMLLWVLENNPYRLFYENLNGKIVEKKQHETLKLPILAYGYDNLKELLNKLENH